MALFRYSALSEQGKQFFGTIDADSLQEARFKLFKQKIAVLRLDLLTQKQKQIKLGKQEVLNLTRELGRLLQAGLPLFEALSALEEKYRGQKPQPLLLDLCDQVRSGKPFSEALAAHSQTFDILYRSMISNAEKTGSLAAAFKELADLLSKQLQVKKQLVSAMLYPALLGGFCLIVLATLLLYVIPSLQELFEGRELHPFTKIVFSVSSFVRNSKGFLLLIFVSISALSGAALYTPRFRSRFIGLVYRIPFIKGILAKTAFVRFCRAASTLLEGGLPLIQAFNQARLVMRHPLLELVIATAEEKISQGESIQAAIQNSPLIPPLIPRMLGIAEQGGKLPYMMRQIAEIYEEELERALAHFTTVAQPVLLLILGGVIGFVLLSVLLPLTDVSSFAAG